MTIDELLQFIATFDAGNLDALLTSQPMDLNHGNANQGLAPLTWAVELNNPDLVKTLLRHGADPNYYADNDDQPLGRAVEVAEGTWDLVDSQVGVPSLDIIRLLVDAGADWTQPWAKDGTTPLDLARSYGVWEIIAYFERCDWQRHIDTVTPVDLEGLIYLHRDEEARAWITANPDTVNQLGDVGQTPLGTAIQLDNYDMVEYLAYHGADLDSLNCDGLTPLGLAIWCAVAHWDHNHRQGQPSTDMIRLLVELGASPVAPPGLGRRLSDDTPDTPTTTYEQFAAGWHHQPARDYFHNLRQSPDGIADVGGPPTRFSLPSLATILHKRKQDNSPRASQQVHPSGGNEPRNVAYMTGVIDNAPVTGVANSGRNSQPGSVAMPNPDAPRLPTHTVGTSANRREYDAEIKLLGNVLGTTTSDSTGQMTLVSERDMCDSCVDALTEFRRLRPHISVSTAFKHPYP